MRFNAYILALLFGLLLNQAIAATYIIPMSELDFSDFLPIRGNCEMDLDGLVTDKLGSQMCISSDDGKIAHYRIIATPGKNVNIQVNSRLPAGSDGLTFTPIGKLISDVDDIDIVPGQVHIVNSGTLGRIDVMFGGEIILSSTFYGSDMSYQIEMEAGIIWEDTP
ncbi:hypothetical protein [Paraglaciecola psychrophila]|uniref:Uncharacterized protein n=1 Tax=Paraglaciecola psychrophila 170 TaxID=1129794 RepID=K7A6X6_9ALTE|nr:hypothetical protein [Paraglaciecola psychrophila]AGH45412.1 hypothetical protein C427_3303 [Paraglaciecola psychrophila 170]GAC38082.1 hypothetical protein GPSY_2466 [Paraglaciecola psychrophila 170]